jgi:hypothetical protein
MDTESMHHWFLIRQGGISYLVAGWLKIYKPTKRSIEKPNTVRIPPLVSLVGYQLGDAPSGQEHEGFRSVAMVLLIQLTSKC